MNEVILINNFEINKVSALTSVTIAWQGGIIFFYNRCILHNQKTRKNYLVALCESV